MISADIQTAIKELEEYKQVLKRKLEHTVRGFAYELTMIASSNTPIGSLEAIQSNKRYARYYFERMELTGIPELPGFHRGAWRADNTNSIEYEPKIVSQSEVGAYVKQGLADYKLGQTVFVGAEGLAFDLFEKGENTQAKQGIITPTRNMIESMYKIHIERYFNEG
jgi:hypothetical protein